MILTCCLESRTSASCLPADTVLFVQTLHGLSITDDTDSKVAGQVIAASKPKTLYTHYCSSARFRICLFIRILDQK